MNNNPLANLMKQDKLIVGISEISKMTGVSTRQLRYWEQKGYIESISDEKAKSREYRLDMVIKVSLIKEELDEGYTLVAAIEHVNGKMDIFRQFKHFLIDRVSDVGKQGNKTVFDMGYFDDSKKQRLFAVIDEKGTRFELRDV
ncbi:MerR family transcriptional regulator [Dellaglioa sp. P0083]|uniref:MerR family transcriptional regulator n=1 Tax=Dellaglioa kimchii TaxID=3344667 RepID=UPI0038D42641